MKKIITAPILAEMLILSTFVADCLPSIENVKHREKRARNKAQEARIDILARVSKSKDKDGQIYDATDTFFDKYYFRYQKSEIIYICLGVLKSYLNNYAFGDSFYNLFKKLHKNASYFQKKDFRIEEKEVIKFIKELKSLTQNSEMQING